MASELLLYDANMVWIIVEALTKNPPGVDELRHRISPPIYTAKITIHTSAMLSFSDTLSSGSFWNSSTNLWPEMTTSHRSKVDTLKILPLNYVIGHESPA